MIHMSINVATSVTLLAVGKLTYTGCVNIDHNCWHGLSSSYGLRGALLGQGTGDWGLGTGGWGLGTGVTGRGTGDWGRGAGDWGLGTGDRGLGTGDRGRWCSKGQRGCIIPTVHERAARGRSAMRKQQGLGKGEWGQQGYWGRGSRMGQKADERESRGQREHQEVGRRAMGQSDKGQ